MQINLQEELAKQFKRVNALAQEAEDDDEESFSSRASAMAAVTSLLKELTKTQAEVVNMERLMKFESVTVEVLKQFLTSEQHDEYLKKLEEMFAIDGL